MGGEIDCKSESGGGLTANINIMHVEKFNNKGNIRGDRIKGRWFVLFAF